MGQTGSKEVIPYDANGWLRLSQTYLNQLWQEDQQFGDEYRQELSGKYSHHDGDSFRRHSIANLNNVPLSNSDRHWYDRNNSRTDSRGHGRSDGKLGPHANVPHHRSMVNLSSSNSSHRSSSSTSTTTGTANTQLTSHRNLPVKSLNPNSATGPSENVPRNTRRGQQPQPNIDDRSRKNLQKNAADHLSKGTLVNRDQIEHRTNRVNRNYNDEEYRANFTKNASPIQVKRERVNQRLLQNSTTENKPKRNVDNTNTSQLYNRDNLDLEKEPRSNKGSTRDSFRSKSIEKDRAARDKATLRDTGNLSPIQKSYRFQSNHDSQERLVQHPTNNHYNSHFGGDAWNGPISDRIPQFKLGYADPMNYTGLEEKEQANAPMMPGLTHKPKVYRTGRNVYNKRVPSAEPHTLHYIPYNDRGRVGPYSRQMDTGPLYSRYYPMLKTGPSQCRIGFTKLLFTVLALANIGATIWNSVYVHFASIKLELGQPIQGVLYSKTQTERIWWQVAIIGAQVVNCLATIGAIYGSLMHRYWLIWTYTVVMFGVASLGAYSELTRGSVSAWLTPLLCGQVGLVLTHQIAIDEYGT